MVARRAEGARPRVTRQGEAVAEVMRASDAFRSAQEIHAQLRRAGVAVGLTTVYRHLQLLADAGSVDSLQRGDGEALYRLCRRHDHHHHIVCRSCGASTELDAPEVEAWAESSARRLGYSEISHTLEIFGLCGNCRS